MWLRNCDVIKPMPCCSGTELGEDFDYAFMHGGDPVL